MTKEIIQLNKHCRKVPKEIDQRIWNFKCYKKYMDLHCSWDSQFGWIIFSQAKPVLENQKSISINLNVLYTFSFKMFTGLCII